MDWNKHFHICPSFLNLKHLHMYIFSVFGELFFSTHKL